MDRDEAIAFLMRDGDLRVMCSRWGRTTSECAEVAYDFDLLISALGGDPMSEDTLDYSMSMVVNDHNDVAMILRAHGNDEMLARYEDELSDS